MDKKKPTKQTNEQQKKKNKDHLFFISRKHFVSKDTKTLIPKDGKQTSKQVKTVNNLA